MLDVIAESVRTQTKSEDSRGLTIKVLCPQEWDQGFVVHFHLKVLAYNEISELLTGLDCS